LFSRGYLANLSGGGADLPRKRSVLLYASRRSILSGQIDQKSMKKEAWMIWKRIEAVRTEPAIQW